MKTVDSLLLLLNFLNVIFQSCEHKIHFLNLFYRARWQLKSARYLKTWGMKPRLSAWLVTASLGLNEKLFLKASGWKRYVFGFSVCLLSFLFFNISRMPRGSLFKFHTNIQGWPGWPDKILVVKGHPDLTNPFLSSRVQDPRYASRDSSQIWYKCSLRVAD